MSNFVFDKGNLSARMEKDILGSWWGRNQRGARLPIVAHVFRSEDGYHSRSLAGRGHINTEQAGVSVVTT